MPSDRTSTMDKIKGGIGDKKTNSDFDKKQLASGAAVEREHTKDKSMAQEIARDHLTEDPEYYVKLRKMEKKAQRLSLLGAAVDASVKLHEKRAGYAAGMVRKANEVGRRVLPAWSTSTKTPAGARRAAKLVSKQPYAPGGPSSVLPPPGSGNRKPLPTFAKAAEARFLDAVIAGLDKHAFDMPKLPSAKQVKGWFKPKRLARGAAVLGKDMATFGLGDSIGNKLVPRWQPKVAGLDKEALGLFAALTAAPVIWEGGKALNRLRKQHSPTAAIGRGLGPKSPKIHGPSPVQTRSQNTPDVTKLAVWGSVAKFVATKLVKAAPTVAKVSKPAGRYLAKATPAGVTRAAKSVGKDVALAAGLAMSANALTHVGRPKQIEPL
jgi:hypothetical protein